MRPPPEGWPRASASVHYDDPLAAIAWLGRAFGLEPRIVVEDGHGGVHHSELVYGEAVVMVAGPRAEGGARLASPRANGGRATAALFFYVDDVDAHCARAVGAGAVIARPLETNDYGEGYWVDRSYGAIDPEGHLWWFGQRISTGGKAR